MATIKLNEFKKYISEMDEEALRDELLKLFGKLNQVKDYYAQELMGEEERGRMLEISKSKIYKEFWTPSGNPKNVNNANVKRIVSEFEKIAVFPYDVIDLLLYRVLLATEYADEFGGASDSTYNSSSTAFAKAVKLMVENKLVEEFRDRCEHIFQFENLGYGYIEDLKDIFEDR